MARILRPGALGIGQGLVLIADGTFSEALVRLSRLASYRVAIERLLGLVLLVVAVYFAWWTSLWL